MIHSLFEDHSCFTFFSIASHILCKINLVVLFWWLSLEPQIGERSKQKNKTTQQQKKCLAQPAKVTSFCKTLSHSCYWRRIHRLNFFLLLPKCVHSWNSLFSSKQWPTKGLVAPSTPLKPSATVAFCFEEIGQEYGEEFPRDLKELVTKQMFGLWVELCQHCTPDSERQGCLSIL